MKGTYRDLIAWQKAMDLVTEIYRETDSFPAREIYGLTNQVRRASIGVPSDIAEGKGRLSKKEFVQMLSRARGSIFEVQTQIEIGRNLGFLSAEKFTELSAKADEVARLISGLIRSLRRQILMKLKT
ncbi:MAG TPA: four helix bundle protein [Thermoanaerobaculia bacterium]|nr:four helix bundle protein [Thermoanaerobaculia bacterium]